MSGQGPGAGSNTELGDFLRSRRARITPQDAGLAPQPGTRRVPGPRREEVARLAGVSVDYADFDQRPHRERNMARYMFLDPGARELYRDWEMSARSTVAALHRYAGRYPDDPHLAELIGDLSVRDTDFRRWWADHDVFRHTHGYKRLRHPVVGDLTLDYESLTVTGDPEQSLGLYTAAAGSASEQALRLLASWVSDPLPPAQPDSAPAAGRPG